MSLYKITKPNIMLDGDETRLFELLNRVGILKQYTKYVKFAFPLLKPIVPIRVTFMDALADPEAVANKRIMHLYHNKQADLLYDLSTEAIVYPEFTGKLLASFHQILRDRKVESRRVHLVCANANAQQYYKDWAIQNGFENYQINMLGYNFYLYEYLWEVKACDWFNKNAQNLIDASYKTVRDDERRTKRFMCLNLRPRWHRTAVVSHLLERGFLDKGDVSYFGHEFDDHGSVASKEEAKHLISKLRSGKRLLPAVDLLHKMAPIQLERDSSQMRNDLWIRKPGEVDFLFPEAQSSNISINTYFEIVNETWLSDQTNMYLTEKTIRPILRLQPFIHVGCPRLLEYLKDIGFETFSPFFNEDYDKIDDPMERLEVIFEEIDRLCRMSDDEIHKIYCELWPRLVHNFHHLLEKMPKIGEKEIETSVFKSIIKCNNKNKLHIFG